MPDEGAPHERTWMAFVARDSIWSRDQVPAVKRDLIRIADTVARYEPVTMLVGRDERREAQAMLDVAARASGQRRHAIELVQCDLDDLWLRDSGPTFVTDTRGRQYAIDFNFNGWGNKQRHGLDRTVARCVARHSGRPIQRSGLVLEGGGFEVDGKGTAILSKSCVLNPNRNPHWTQPQVEDELNALLGVEKIIWLEGVAGKDITDGHTDFYARFIRPGVVAVGRDNDPHSFDYEVTRENIRILQNSSDASGTRLNLLVLDAPERINEAFGRSDFAAGYVGYYLCNGAVIAQRFGDRQTDQRAREILRSAFPQRVVEQIAIDGIASGGGSIHCTTQQQPRL